MDNQIKNMVRVGRVSSINPATGTARVAFEPQGVVSYDLQILVPQTMKNKDYYMPDIGEHVVCLFLPTGNQEGFIMGAVYSNEDKPPVSSPDKRRVEFEDGTWVEYDRKSHMLEVYGVGELKITAEKDLAIAVKNIVITAEKDISINAETMSVNIQETLSISAPKGITISAPDPTGTGVVIVGKSDSGSW